MKNLKELLDYPFDRSIIAMPTKDQIDDIVRRVPLEAAQIQIHTMKTIRDLLYKEIGEKQLRDLIEKRK